MVSDLVSPDSKRSHSLPVTQAMPCDPGLVDQREAAAQGLEYQGTCSDSLLATLRCFRDYHKT